MLDVAAAPELFDHTLWSSATDERREELARLVAGQIGGEFSYVGLRRYGEANAPVAVFEHASAGEFSLVPGGGFDMGLSPEEEATIRERHEADGVTSDELDQMLSEIGSMRPLHRVVVGPLLIAQRVLRVGQAERWLSDSPDDVEDPKEVHFSPEQVSAVLAASGLRLPSEAELEYAARGGLHRRPLPWGDRLPAEAMFKALLDGTDGSARNGFGLYGYGMFPELCADHWHANYEGAPDDGAAWLDSGPRVVRGGAADYYPWQTCGECFLMLCALRLHEEMTELGTSLRLVHGLGEHETPDGEAGGATKAKAGKAAKKSGAEKSSAKKAAKKSPAKKATKKATKKKSATKKSSAKKAGAKKEATKKAGATAKSGAKKAATKKSATKKSTKKAGATKKSTAKKSTKKAGATKKSPAKKSTKKSAAKKSTKKAGAAKKSATKKVAKRAR